MLFSQEVNVDFIASCVYLIYMKYSQTHIRIKPSPPKQTAGLQWQTEKCGESSRLFCDVRFRGSDPGYKPRTSSSSRQKSSPVAIYGSVSPLLIWGQSAPPQAEWMALLKQIADRRSPWTTGAARSERPQAGLQEAERGLWKELAALLIMRQIARRCPLKQDYLKR